MNILKQLSEFKTLLTDISRKLDIVIQTLQEQQGYSVTIVGDRDGWQDFKDIMNWTGQDDRQP